jgi:hypothetical protein
MKLLAEQALQNLGFSCVVYSLLYHIACVLVKL